MKNKLLLGLLALSIFSSVRVFSMEDDPEMQKAIYASGFTRAKELFNRFQRGQQRGTLTIENLTQMRQDAFDLEPLGRGVERIANNLVRVISDEIKKKQDEKIKQLEAEIAKAKKKATEEKVKPGEKRKQEAAAARKKKIAAAKRRAKARQERQRGQRRSAPRPPRRTAPRTEVRVGPERHPEVGRLFREKVNLLVGRGRSIRTGFGRPRSFGVRVGNTQVRNVVSQLKVVGQFSDAGLGNYDFGNVCGPLAMKNCSILHQYFNSRNIREARQLIGQLLNVSTIANYIIDLNSWRGPAGEKLETNSCNSTDMDKIIDEKGNVLPGVGKDQLIDGVRTLDLLDIGDILGIDGALKDVPDGFSRGLILVEGLAERVLSTNREGEYIYNTFEELKGSIGHWRCLFVVKSQGRFHWFDLDSLNFNRLREPYFERTKYIIYRLLGARTNRLPYENILQRGRQRSERLQEISVILQDYYDNHNLHRLQRLNPGRIRAISQFIFGLEPGFTDSNYRQRAIAVLERIEQLRSVREREVFHRNVQDTLTKFRAIDTAYKYRREDLKKIKDKKKLEEMVEKLTEIGDLKIGRYNRIAETALDRVLKRIGSVQKEKSSKK